MGLGNRGAAVEAGFNVDSSCVDSGLWDGFMGDNGATMALRRVSRRSLSPWRVQVSAFLAKGKAGGGLTLRPRGRPLDWGELPSVEGEADGDEGDIGGRGAGRPLSERMYES